MSFFFFFKSPSGLPIDYTLSDHHFFLWRLYLFPQTDDILEDLRQLEQLAAAAHDFGTPASVSQIPGGAPLKRAGELLGEGGMCVRTG